MGKVAQQFYKDMYGPLGVTMPMNDWLIFCQAWQTTEGGGAKHNPFNTTEPMPGSTKYNSVGVQNYLNRDQGVTATVNTLKQKQYANLLTAMRSNADPYYLAVMIGIGPWGTNTLLFVKVLAENYGFGKTR